MIADNCLARYCESFTIKKCTFIDGGNQSLANYVNDLLLAMYGLKNSILLSSYMSFQKGCYES